MKLQKIAVKYTFNTTRNINNNTNLKIMDQKKLNRIITLHYDKWVNYSRKIAYDFHLEEEATDILNQVLCDIIAKNQENPIKLNTGCKNEEKSILYYITKTIKRNIVSPTAPCQKQYRQDRIKLNREIDISLLNIPDVTTEYTDKREILKEIYKQLDIPEYNRRVFELYYSGEHCLKQCTGTESIASVSRKCQHIRKMIRNQIRFLYKGVLS